MKRITTTNAVLAAAALYTLVASGPLLAQTTTSPDSADPSPKAIEVYRADAARTGYDPVTVAFPLSTVWRLSGVDKTANPDSLVAEGGIVYYGSGTNLVAVREDNGQQRWSTAIPSDGKVLSTPAISGNYLYVGSSTGSFYKINRGDGSIVWTFKTQTGILSSPVVSQGMVFFGSQDTNCYAVNTETGKVVWQFAANAPVNAPPSVNGDIVVFASTDYNVYAFDEASGRQRWTAQISDDPSIGPPAMSGNSVTVAAGQWLYSFNVRTGALRWKTRFDGNIVSSPAVGPTGVYVATDDNKVHGLNNRGDGRWSTTVGAAPASGILLTDSGVIVGTKQGGLYSFDPSSGAINWDYAIQPDPTVSVTKVQIEGTPVYVNKTLFVLSDDGALTAFRHDGADSAPPRISAQLPKPGSIVASKDLTFSATVVDDGSGIDPSSVKFMLDGASLPGAHYDADQNGVVADPMQVKALNLTNGLHVVVVQAKDWRGNTVNRSWGFTIDRTLNPKGSSDSPDETAAPDDTVPSGDTTTPMTAPNNVNPRGGRATPPAAGKPPPPPVF